MPLGGNIYRGKKPQKTDRNHLIFQTSFLDRLQGQIVFLETFASLLEYFPYDFGAIHQTPMPTQNKPTLSRSIHFPVSLGEKEKSNTNKEEDKTSDRQTVQ